MESRGVKSAFWAGGFLYNHRTKEILLHKRDAKADVNPNKWGFFGGSSEKGETPQACCLREWNEELGIKVLEKDLILVSDYLNVKRNTWRYVFYAHSDLSKSEMVLGEGEDFDWIALSKVFEYDITEKTRQDLETFMRTGIEHPSGLIPND